MSDLLSIGVTGLNVSKKALETTGHNLANANTEGYSRQRVNQTSNVPISKSGLVVGSGARITGVNRVHDQFIEKRLNSTISDHEFHKESAMQLDQIQNIFNEIDNDGLNKIMNKFYNSFRELANQPENETIRSVVRDNAALAVKDFRRIRGTLDDLARNVDRKLEMDVKSINQLVKNVAKLNKKIAIIEANGDETGDLRDQRDLAIRDLSTFFKINSYTDNNGNYNVSAKGVGSLVSAGEYQELDVVSKSKIDSSNNMAGSVEVVFKNKPKNPITKNFSGGTFTSLLNTRNDHLENAQKQMDKLAFQFIQTTNAVHRRGYVNREIKVDQNGNPAQQDSVGPTTGINFFKDVDKIDGAASIIDLSENVKDDISNITTALSPNSPGDNRVAIGISKIQHEKILDNGTTTIEEKFLQTVGQIGMNAGKANLDAEQSDGLLAQTKAVKERLSGVSIDEETANLVRYQQAYDASAKVLKSADEMFKTVLGII